MSGALAVVSRRGVSTPGLLWRFLGAIVVLAVVAGGVSLWTSAKIRDAAQTIGRDAEPSVALALRMAAALSDMDAAVLADALTGSGEAAGTSAQFRDALSQLSTGIVEASRNITYGEAEAAPLRELQARLALYQQAVADARYAGQGDAWTTSRRLQWASRVNQLMATPPALALARANEDELEKRYASYRATSLAYGTASVAAFGVLAAALVAAQIWLAQRVRRRVNPAMALATVVALLGGAWLGSAVLHERTDLRAAKSDAYDSLHVLFEAKAAVNAMRADASLWLLDPEARQAAQVRIDADAKALIGVDPGAAQQSLVSALTLERSGQVAEALRQTQHLDGLLGTEFDNITFGVPEREAATDAVARLGEAEKVIRTVQAQDGRTHAAAVAAWLDARPGGGVATFAALQTALNRTIDVNQGEFDVRVADALRTADRMPFVVSGSLALSVLLAAAGLWPRLREYR